jgi:PST family polysaccharide transporter
VTFNQLLKQGLLISFAARFSNILVQLIVGMILARLLSPAEFGIFAIIMLYIVIFYLMINIGIGPAVIQSKEVNKTGIAIYFYLSIAHCFLKKSHRFFVFTYSMFPFIAMSILNKSYWQFAKQVPMQYILYLKSNKLKR